ncbi:hypothetical protein F5B22DRAFT_360678 [Xylaria bambusicola]|uniref:uncharacterized protein n=1 Tax=Xylaria bambusicola TaxID=326684 RepID=UPI002008AACA|nr:uncharacterized protein F5B22DRAFT_360678 [Xylaria bambusicola]KAI0509322.1 hypothetical protein F5B22DRAFT_360678 [Xylaria bambusicola]
MRYLWVACAFFCAGLESLSLLPFEICGLKRWHWTIEKCGTKRMDVPPSDLYSRQLRASSPSSMPTIHNPPISGYLCRLTKYVYICV